KLDEFRSRFLGYADQHYAAALAPELTARELIALPLDLAGVSRRHRVERADALLEIVGLADRGSARPFELSGGEQQRIAVAAAVARQPRLLLADEPTAELDSQNAADVYRLIEGVVRRESASAIVVSHDPASTAIADRIVHVRDGRVSAETGRNGSEGESIVVGRGGWIRLPEDFLHRSRIVTRASARIEGEHIIVRGDEEVPERRPEVKPRRLDAGAAPIAELRDVVKEFGSGPSATEVFAGFSAALSKGRFTVVTGPSGSGKSTLLNLLAGLELPSAGDVVVLGETLSNLDRAARAALRRTRLGLVAQDTSLVPYLSARENVVLTLATRGLQDADIAAEEALTSVGLAELAEQRVARLSMGERQRVAIARAVAAGPELLLADEPTARLDAANALEIGALLSRLVHERETTIICATHDPLVIEQADDELELRR
ncbi:MAG TPA: ATP-binding cassette domain-containing protein, partial [Gaiellaceae bacterium]|nr:ATP-binding cassette domain-containing protein [Gaiellaceae bacterium]